jgi:hypothetical protein
MSTPSLTVEEQLDRLALDVANLREEIRTVREDIARAVQIIEKVTAEVMPTVEALLNIPAIRMFIGKKKS